MRTDVLYDPLRRREVACTPEEEVRQWFIVQLRDALGVPAHLMMSEAPLKFGGKAYRADILIYDRSGQPLAVVECKRPSVALGAEVARQALRYDMVLSVRWIILVNGTSVMAFRREGGSFVPSGSLPNYEKMLCLH